MKDFVYYNELFDLYKELLTKKEQEIFTLYYSEDLSYSEIATNKRISRSAIGKTIKIVLEKLDDYEKKLGNYKLKQKILKSLDTNSMDNIKKIINDILER